MNVDSLMIESERIFALMSSRLALMIIYFLVMNCKRCKSRPLYFYTYAPALGNGEKKKSKNTNMHKHT